MRFVDNTWLFLPAFRARGIWEFWSVIPAFLGIGGLWVVFFPASWWLALLPENNPQLDPPSSSTTTMDMETERWTSTTLNIAPEGTIPATKSEMRILATC